MKVTIVKNMSGPDYIKMAEWLLGNYDFTNVVVCHLSLSDGDYPKSVHGRTRKEIRATIRHYNEVVTYFPGAQPTIEQNHTYQFTNENVGMEFALKFSGRIDGETQ